MKTIGEYRARYPQLRELTDYQLTRAVYDTTAPDMPLEDFAKAFGGVTEEDPEEVRIQEYNLSHPDDTIRREDMGKGEPSLRHGAWHRRRHQRACGNPFLACGGGGH